MKSHDLLIFASPGWRQAFGASGCSQNLLRFSSSTGTQGQRRASILRVIGLALMSTLLSACATFVDDAAEDWPPQLPPVSFFAAVYAQDAANAGAQTVDEYLYWVRNFYEGNLLYPRGWNSITEDILAETQGASKLELRREELFRLGQKIAAEWAKDTSVNLVENAHLAVWGIAAGRAVDEDNVDETLAMISEDVDLLITQDLGPDAITAGRYHPQDEDDFFAM